MSSRSSSRGSSNGPSTPTSSACDSLGNRQEEVSSDTPVESIEHDFASLRVREVAVTVSPPPDARDSLSPETQIHNQLEQLDLGKSRQASRSISLSPNPQGSPLSGRRRRSLSPSNTLRHEVDQEVLPASTFYHREFQDALAKSRSLAQRLTKTLSNSTLHTQETGVQNLYEQALAISQDQGPEKWRIGLVGDSGAGKSSLINSLLDHKGLARSSSSGSACTCAVTEYHHHEASNFVVAITYFSLDDLIDQFEELLRKFRQFDDIQKQGSQSAKLESADLEKAASVAWHTFSCAFRGQRSLSKNWLLQEEFQAILETFRQWMTQSAPNGYMPEGGVLTRIAEDATKCSEMLLDVSSEAVNTGTVASWPYIKSITVYLRAMVLSKGLILVDLPGLRDTNSARQAITENYITRYCNEVFAVANIARAATDVGIKDVLKLTQATTANDRSLNVSVICTRSDDIDAEEASNDWKGAKRQTLRKIMDELHGLREELREIEAEMEDEVSNEVAGELAREQMMVQKQVREAEYRQMEFLTKTRNDIVTAGLRRAYRGQMQEIFCVSNRVYFDHRDKPPASAIRWLQLSGIISLRQHCIGLVADHQLQHAKVYIKEKVPHLVSSIDLWVQSGSSSITAATRAQINDASKQVERTLVEALGRTLSPCNRISGRLNDKCQEVIRAPFETDKDEMWSKIAMHAFYGWNGVMTFAAFCRNWGDHSTPKATDCWNEKIISGMTRDLRRPWQSMRAEVSKIIRKQLRDSDRCIEQSVQPLQNVEVDPVSERENMDAVQTLLQAILERKDLLLSEIQTITSKFLREFLELATVDFLSPIRSSFIGQEMEATYQKTSRESGTGSDRRRKNLIKSKIADPNLFQNLYTRFEEDFRVLTADVEKKIRVANKAYLRDVRAALDTLRTANVLHEAEQHPAFRELVRGEVADARVALDRIAVATRGSLGSGALGAGDV